jgi:hypothetical protein
MPAAVFVCWIGFGPTAIAARSSDTGPKEVKGRPSVMPAGSSAMQSAPARAIVPPALGGAVLGGFLGNRIGAALADETKGTPTRRRCKPEAGLANRLAVNEATVPSYSDCNIPSRAAPKSCLTRCAKPANPVAVPAVADGYGHSLLPDRIRCSLCRHPRQGIVARRLKPPHDSAQLPRLCSHCRRNGAVMM